MSHRLTITGLLILGYLAIGLRPFELDPVGNGAVIHPEGGVAFPSRGILRSTAPPSWLPEAIARGSLEIDLEVRSLGPEQLGPARILTISRDVHRRDLTIGQEGAGLIVRLRRPGSDANGEPRFVVPGLLGDSRWHRVRVALTRREIRIRVDGRPVLWQTFTGDLFTGWDPRARIALGNEVWGNRPWIGEVRRARVRFPGGEHDYARPDSLERPRVYWRLENAPYSRLPRFVPFWAHPLDLEDLALNLFGFMPLGAVLRRLWQRRPGAGLALGLCALTSLGIEGGQVFVVGRTPQLTDLVLNIGGAWIGLCLAGAVRLAHPRGAALARARARAGNSPRSPSGRKG